MFQNFFRKISAAEKEETETSPLMFLILIAKTITLKNFNRIIKS